MEPAVTLFAEALAALVKGVWAAKWFILGFGSIALFVWFLASIPEMKQDLCRDHCAAMDSKYVSGSHTGSSCTCEDGKGRHYFTKEVKEVRKFFIKEGK